MTTISPKAEMVAFQCARRVRAMEGTHLCHLMPAVSFEQLLSEVKARYVVGLTATSQRRDGQQPINHMQIGSVRFKADPRNQLAQRPFAHRFLVREIDFDPPTQISDITIQ